ncbi:MAG: TerB family tellurite resistance protein [Myxococcota bacterium]
MFEGLDRRQRMHLIKFVCSFAWADLEVQAEERAFVARLVERLDLDNEDRAQVRQWLEVPPAVDSVDPMTIPQAHRKIFLEAIEGVIAADGEVSAEERETLSILQDLFNG